MKKITLPYLFIFIFFHTVIKADYWTQKADFAGTPRADATGFSIGNKGYIGTGYDGLYQNDMWEYDPTLNAWTQKSNYGGNGIVESVSFNIGNNGYILAAPSDSAFWQFDPITNVWTQKAYFPGGARQAAVSFSINNKGYVCSGLGSTVLNDLWEYDPFNNLWTQKANLPGPARYYACSFSIGNFGYITTGYGPAFSALNDMWAYDQINDSWSQKANFPGAARVEASAINIGNFGYIGLGSGNGIYFNDFWQYDPTINTWLQRATFSGAGREEASQFSIGNYGYIGTGYDGVTAGACRKDFWQYNPQDSSTAITNITSADFFVEIYPNPFHDVATLKLNGINPDKLTYSICNMSGQTLCTEAITQEQINIKRNDLAAGTYFCLIKNNDKEVSRIKIVIQ